MYNLSDLQQPTFRVYQSGYVAILIICTLWKAQFKCLFHKWDVWSDLTLVGKQNVSHLLIWTENLISGWTLSGWKADAFCLRQNQNRSFTSSTSCGETQSCALTLNDSPDFVLPRSCSKLASGRSNRASSRRTHAPSRALSKQAPMTSLCAKKHADKCK